MNAAPQYPEIPPSAYATDLHARLDFQGRVNTVLLASTRAKDKRPRGEPLLSSAELHELERAYECGVTPEAFAATITARDQRAASEPPVRALVLAGGRP